MPICPDAWRGALLLRDTRRAGPAWRPVHSEVRIGYAPRVNAYSFPPVATLTLKRRGSWIDVGDIPLCLPMHDPTCVRPV